MLKLIIDENIAFADKAFEQFGVVTLLPGRAITNNVLKDADVLIVRSITNVDKKLLKNTPIKFVGTATIGTDHIDLDYLKDNNIAFADAKGCNAFSVAEYIIAALLNLSVRLDFSLKDKSIGVVGVGNVGSKVAAFAEALGMKVLLNDPPLQRSGDNRELVELDEILSADIITLHVPLNKEGIDKTYHLFDKKILNKLKDGTILVNSARGAVIKNEDLLDVITNKKLKVVLDVWENEPDINLALLKNVLIGTPHIAGYSYEGKVNGSRMVYNSLCDFFGADKIFPFHLELPQDFTKHFIKSDRIETRLEKLISSIYSISDDDLRMRKMLEMNVEGRIKYFDLQRKNYPIRREFSYYTVVSDLLNNSEINLLKKLRFNIS